MDTRRSMLIYWALGIIGTTVVILAVFLPARLDIRIAGPVILVYRFGMEWYRINSILRRPVPESVANGILPYRVRIWEILVWTISIILLVVFILLDSHEFKTLFLMPLIATGQMSEGFYWLSKRQIPRYVVTNKELIANTFKIDSRSLEDLHSIEISGLFPKIKIRFSNQYDIVIRKSLYSKAELAAFLQAIIDHSDSTAELDPEVQTLLKSAEPLNIEH